MKTTLLFLLFLGSISFLNSCKKEDVATEDSPVDKNPEEPSIVYNVNKSIILNLVNDQRENGCICGAP